MSTSPTSPAVFGIERKYTPELPYTNGLLSPSASYRMLRVVSENPSPSHGTSQSGPGNPSQRTNELKSPPSLHKLSQNTPKTSPSPYMWNKQSALMEHSHPKVVVKDAPTVQTTELTFEQVIRSLVNCIRTKDQEGCLINLGHLLSFQYALQKFINQIDTITDLCDIVKCLHIHMISSLDQTTLKRMEPLRQAGLRGSRILNDYLLARAKELFLKSKDHSNVMEMFKVLPDVFFWSSTFNLCSIRELAEHKITTITMFKDACNLMYIGEELCDWYLQQQDEETLLWFIEDLACLDIVKLKTAKMVTQVLARRHKEGKLSAEALYALRLECDRTIRILNSSLFNNPKLQNCTKHREILDMCSHFT